MSRENVEVVQRLLDAWAAGDFEAAREEMHPDIEWRAPPQTPEDSVHRGHKGVSEAIGRWIGAWENYRYDPREMLDAGEKVLVAGHQSGRGKRSRVEVSSELFQLWTIRDGKAVEMRMFTERDDALNAAGLRE